MRAVLEVRWGRQQGEKLVFEPGQRKSVGRTTPSDLVVPLDRQLSGVHFDVTWDGVTAQFRDKGSLSGSEVDGVELREATLEHGSWIKAGETVFMFWHEGASPPPEPEEETVAERAHLDLWAETGLLPKQIREQALTTLQSEPEHLYGVFDAAKCERIVELLRESVERYQSLYEGVDGETFEEEAPYLVQLPKDSRLLRVLVAEGWGKRWGIYVASSRSFREVRRHLRRFLLVYEEAEKRRLYFRFYDPGVLRNFLPVATRFQLESMFREISRFWIEDPRGKATAFSLPPAAQ